MKIPTSEIPQANTLQHVLDVAYAVNEGARTDRDIAEYIRMVPRQGRYHRLAAELLGLVKNTGNHALLTPLGKKFIQMNEQGKNEIVKNAILSARVFQRMIPYFEAREGGATRQDIENFIANVTAPTTDVTIRRRTSTIVRWLEEIGVLSFEGNSYKIDPSSSSPSAILHFSDEEPLAPKSPDLNEYITVKERLKRASEFIQVMINQAARERANSTHRDLLNMVAERIRSAGSTPRNNRFVDLAATLENQAYLFEMKSVNSSNWRSQLRGGLSQLYEYRYLQNLPEAKLVLVISDPLDKKNSWIQEYLEADREIHLIWDGNDQLFASKKTQQELAFLWR